METAAARVRKSLHTLLGLREHPRSEGFAMRDEDEMSEQHPTFTSDEFRDAPSAVMRAVKQSGRVVITDDKGEPQLTIARQVDELNAG